MLCARVPEAVRDLVRKAAKIEGLSVQEFVTSALSDEAVYVIEEHESGFLEEEE